MNNRKLIVAGVIATLFLFAGYNLLNYFKTQEAIKIEQAQKEEERKIKREEERKERESQRLLALEKEKLRIKAEKQERIDERKRKEAEAEAKRVQAEKARLKRKQQRDEKRKKDRTNIARSLKHIEGISKETITKFNQVSADYIRNNPSEFLGKKFNGKMLGAYKDVVKLLSDDTNALMLYSAVSSDIDVIKALIDIGIDINEQNKKGYTPLMFASAYNSPEIIRFLLGRDADTSIKAHVLDMNALHVASLINPNPDSIEVLVRAGLDLETETENGYTPLLIAITENKNLEVAEKLAELGADTRAKDENNISVYSLAQKRISGAGSEFVSISESVNERILKKMK